MMMRFANYKKMGVIILSSCLSTGSVFAQSDDFGLWSEVNVEKKINRDLSLEGGVEFRTRDNVSEADRWSAGVGVEYRLTDWLKGGVGYMLIDDHRYKLNDSGKKYADFWGLRHRMNVSLTASQTWGALTVSLRERWQYTYRPSKTVTRYYTATGNTPGAEADEHTYDGKGKSVWRNRLQAKYKLSKVFRPYASVETSVAKGLEKVRYAAGAEIRLSKQHWLNAGYLFQSTHGDDDEGNRHVVSIGYTYKF